MSSATHSASVKEKIAQHPCYSAQAHQYARIHLPVAPACNIQCNYCNRKFDCSNESRPGVVSKLLSPAQAASRYAAVKKRMPNLKVAGIAGPGDALANPKSTFATLKAINNIDPDVQLCISTNGLALPEHIDSLVNANVHHLTITMNTLDPTIGQYLYAWVYHDQHRLFGLEAAEALIEQQLLGLRLASEAGLLVKINTVLVPGISDTSLHQLAKEIKQRGAFLHNVMPLISDPAHGTYFGLNHVRGPNEQEVMSAQIAAGNDMNQMTHCKQCRADAVGTLDESGGCPSTTSNAVRIAIASKDGQVIDTHFGHATHFWIFDVARDTIRFIEKRDVDQYCVGQSHCDDKSATLDSLIASLHDCHQVHCVRLGMAPWQQLEQANIQPVTDFAYTRTEEALDKIKQNIVNDQAPLQEVS
jgi:nitrogen fixation protein NifB